MCELVLGKVKQYIVFTRFSIFIRIKMQYLYYQILFIIASMRVFQIIYSSVATLKQLEREHFYEYMLLIGYLVSSKAGETYVICSHIIQFKRLSN